MVWLNAQRGFELPNRFRAVSFQERTTAEDHMCIGQSGVELQRAASRGPRLVDVLAREKHPRQLQMRCRITGIELDCLLERLLGFRQLIGPDQRDAEVV